MGNLLRCHASDPGSILGLVNIIRSEMYNIEIELSLWRNADSVFHPSEVGK